ncbi:MAG: AAA family ATPase [Akkermansia sp.]|nr:AAA family ATPase [Akkermansia sp.]
MYIEEIRIENIRGIKSEQIKFCSGVNLIVGVNGSGKSSVLDSIAYTLSNVAARLKKKGGIGKYITNTDIRIGSKEALIEAEFVNSGEKLNITMTAGRLGYAKNKESNYSRVQRWASGYYQQRAEGKGVSYPLLVHYKVNRAILDIPQRQAKLKNIDEPLTGYEAAFEGGGNFRSFFAWFREMEDLEMERKTSQGDYEYKLPELEAVRKALSIVLPGITNIRIRRRHQAMVATKNGVEISIAQLSDGEKCYLALVGDIASRLARLNLECKKSVEEILSSNGIVLIDELDLHLHAKWQREVIRLLPKIFSGIQFIVTTHSMILLRELSLMQCNQGNSSSIPIRFFSMYEKENEGMKVEATEKIDELKNLVASAIQLDQDTQLLRCYGYEL